VKTRVKTKTTLLLITLLVFSIVAAYHAPIQPQITVSASPDIVTLYLNNEEHTVNGFTAKCLNETSTASEASATATEYGGANAISQVVGDISLYKIKSDGSQEQLTDWVAHASASVDVDYYHSYEGIISGTYSFSEPVLFEPGDALRIRWRAGAYDSVMGRWFYVYVDSVTDAFPKGALIQGDWTVYYEVRAYVTYSGSNYYPRIQLKYGDGDTRIENVDLTRLHLKKVSLTLSSENVDLQPSDYFVIKVQNETSPGTIETVTYHVSDGENVFYIYSENPILKITSTSWLSDSSVRWFIPDEASGSEDFEGKVFNYITVDYSSTSSSTFTYYKQFYVTWHVVTLYGTPLNSTNYVSGYCYKSGSQLTVTPLYDGHDLSDWCDAGSQIWTDSQSTQTSPEIGGKKWLLETEQQTVTSSGTYTFYYRYVYADLYYVNVSLTKGDPDFISTDSSNYFNLYWTDRWLSLDGDDYLETSYDSAFDLNVFTIEIWFKPTYTGTASTFHPIISKKYALYDTSVPWPSTLSAWSYRKKITIQNNDADTILDVVNMTIHYGSGADSNFDIYLNSKCKTDFGDLRFTDSNGNLLNYWMEKKTDSDYAVFWVKVDIAASGSKDIYIYYGNPDAIYSGDGDAVFQFFDDFEGTDLDTDKWGTIENTNYAVENGYIKMWGDWNSKGIFSAQTFDLSKGIVVELKGRISNTGADQDLAVGVTPDKSGCAEGNGIWAYYDSYSTSNPYDQKSIRYFISGSSDDSGFGLPGTTDWVRMRIIFTQEKTIFWDEVLGEDTKEKSVSWTDVYLSIAGDTDSTSRFDYIDWIAVRKYAEPEPSISAIGGEEQNVFRGWGVGWVGSNVLGAFVEDGDERNVVQLSAGEGLDGAIHQLVVVFASDSIKIYLDGAFKASTTRTISDVTEEAPLRIGYDGVNYGVFHITELRFYNRPLSADEISSNNHRDLEPTQTGLIIWYEFTNVSNQVIDVTWNGRDAEIHGDPQQIEETATKIVYEGVSLQIWQKGGDVISTDTTSTGSNENELWDILENEWTVDSTSHIFYYWDHLRVSLQVQLSKPYSRELSETNYAVVTATSYGNNFTYAVWPNGTDIKIWVDRGGNVYWPTTTSASTSNHRWATPGGITLEGVDQPAVSSAVYYEQYKVTWHLEKAHQNFTDTSSTNYFNATGQQFNGTLTLTGLYTGHDLTDWIDYQSTITISTYSSGSNSTHRWISCGESYQISSAGTFTFRYREEILTTLEVLDAEGDALPEDSITQLYLQQFNGSTGVVEVGEPTWFEAYVKHDVVKVYWRRLWTEDNIRSMSFYVSGNETEIEVPMIWGDVGGSDMEVYIEASEGDVYAPIWDGMQQVLMISVDQKAPGQLYLYYGPIGSSPRSVIVDGIELSDYAWEVDAAKQLVRVRLGYSAYVFDFSGATQPETVETSNLLQQILAVLQQIRVSGQFVNISSTVRVQRLNISMILGPVVGLYRFIAEWVDTHLPISHVILFPAILVAVMFFGIASIINKFSGRREPSGVGAERAPPPRGSVSGPRWVLFVVLQSIAFTAVVFYFAPTIWPQQFQRPPIPFQILLVAAALASLFAALMVLAITWREGR